MSLIYTVFVKQGRVYFCTLHIHRILDLLNSSFSELPELLEKIKNKAVLDAGYFIIDFNDKIIFSNQTGFASDHIKNKKILQEWNYIENY